MTTMEKIAVKNRDDLAAAWERILLALDAADPDGTFEIRVRICNAGAGERPQPDRDRVERIAGGLLGAWFNAHCVLPEEAPRLVGSREAVDRAIALAMSLVSKIDELGLSPPAIERANEIMRSMADEQLRAAKVGQAQEAERIQLLRDHNAAMHGAPSGRDG